MGCLFFFKYALNSRQNGISIRRMADLKGQACGKYTALFLEGSGMDTPPEVA
jgi:hypothetical protein